MQRAQGNLETALKAYQDVLAIAETLAAQDPSNSEWQRDLIVSYVKLAEVAEQEDAQLPRRNGTIGWRSRSRWHCVMAVGWRLWMNGWSASSRRGSSA